MLEDYREIEGAADFETGKARNAPLGYSLTWREGVEGLVFVIPGFGADAGSNYAASLRRRVLRKHNLAAVSVHYHCLGARPQTGAQIQLEPSRRLQLIGLAHVNGIHLPDPQDLDGLCAAFAAAGMTVQVPAVLELPHGDLQNFGVVQAMDHLMVLGDILEKGPKVDPRRIIAFGSSHGGYIAHMIAKLAPRSLAAVIDNSSYVRPPTSYAGGGADPEYGTQVGGVQFLCRTRRAFSYDDRTAPDFYGADQDLIRHLGHPPHLAIQRAAAGDRGPAFRMANAAQDPISPPEEKLRQSAFLTEAGFDAGLDLIDESRIDGQVFRAMVHGLDASLGGFADMHLPGCGRRGVDPDVMTGTTVEYPGVDEVYTFTHCDRFPYVKGERRPRFAPSASVASARAA